MAHVHRMREAIRVRDDLRPDPRDDIRERPPVLGHRLVEPGGDIVRRDAPADRAVAATCGVEILRRETDHLRGGVRCRVALELTHDVVDHADVFTPWRPPTEASADVLPA